MLYRNTAGYIDASMVVIATGAALEAGTVNAFVRKKSNDGWLQADGSWNAVKPVGANIPTMTHESGGLWRLAHTPADADDAYMINCIDSGATCYPDNYQVTILTMPFVLSDLLAAVVEGALTLKQVLRIMLAALAGKTTGGGTATVIFRDNADAKPRITATVEAGGNRTAITLDGSD